MSNDRATSPISVPSSSAHHRRPSLASGLTFTDYFSKSGNQSVPSGSHAASLTSAVPNTHPNQRRRLSISTLGLSGSPTQTSSLGARNPRHGSLSSSVGSLSNADDVVMDDGENNASNITPSSPFSRRVSFGAQALRDVRGGSIGNGRHPTHRSPVTRGRRSASTTSPVSAIGPSGSVVASTHKICPQNNNSNKLWRALGEGFNWSEALRTRAERAPSIGTLSPSSGPNQNVAGMGQHNYHQRAASIASMEQPAREIPKQPKQNKPDFFQEKILRGDFMD